MKKLNLYHIVLIMAIVGCALTIITTKDIYSERTIIALIGVIVFGLTFYKMIK